MTRIGIILGSTRPVRNGEQVAKRVLDIALRRDDAEFELIDLRGCSPLPIDAPMPPSMGAYADDHTEAWAEKIASFDGFVVVTPEYNHSTSGVPKGAYLRPLVKDPAIVVGRSHPLRTPPAASWVQSRPHVPAPVAGTAPPARCRAARSCASGATAQKT
jgi:hypothetical protein